MMNTRRVLVTAEPYGFGPSSKMLAITRELVKISGVTADFVGTGTAASAARRESEIFGRVTDLERDHADQLVEAVRGYGLVVSVMEPSLSLVCATQNIPCLYVDSLFWMWDWPDHLAEPGSHTERLIRCLTNSFDLSKRAALEEALSLPMHEAQYVAHRVATHLYCQDYGDLAASESTATRDACTVRHVGAIVDRPCGGRGIESKSFNLVVSVSGLSNDLTDTSLASGWAYSVLDTLDEAIRGTVFEDFCVRVGGNGDVLSVLPISSSWNLDIRPWSSHRDFMFDLACADALLAPPGITSIAEAWAVGVPFVSLPSQHYAHSTILSRLRGDNSEDFPAIEVDTGPLDSDIGDATAAVLAATAAELRPFSNSRRAAVENLRRALQTLHERRSLLVARQNRRLTELFGSADGATCIAREALNML